MKKNLHEKAVRQQKHTSGNPAGGMYPSSVIHLILVILLACVIYSNTLRAEFHFDDYLCIVQNQAIRNFDALLDYQNLVTDPELRLQMKSRFIGFASFVLNYKLHGLDVVGFHLTNIGIHIANGMLLYWLVLLAFQTPFFQGSATVLQNKRQQGVCALLCALLFVAHPVQTQAITYIVQRLASLATFFYLLSLFAYIRSRLSGRKKEQYCWYAAAFCSAVLAMRTKEISFTLPLAIGMFEFFFFTAPAKIRILNLSPIVVTLLVIPLSLVDFNQNSLSGLMAEVSGKTQDAKSLSRTEYLMTQGSVILTYLRLLIFPVNQALDYDFPINTTLFTFRTVSSASLLMCLFTTAVFLFFRSRNAGSMHRTEYRFIAFGIFFFFGALTVESSIMPLRDVIYEHRLYLPSIGFFIALVTAGIVLAEHIRAISAKKIFVAAAALVIVAYAVATFARNAVWKDEVTLWEDAVAKSPAKARPHNNLGLAYERSGRIADAFREYGNALKADQNYVEAYNNLGSLYERSGYPDAALRTYVAGIAKHPDNATLYYNLGVLHERLGNLDEAERTYQHAIKLNTKFAEAHNNLGIVYLKRGQLDPALIEFRRAIAINPAFDQARNNLENAPKLFRR